MEMLPGIYPGHQRQDALQDALDKKQVIPGPSYLFGSRAFFHWHQFRSVESHFYLSHRILPNHFNRL